MRNGEPRATRAFALIEQLLRDTAVSRQQIDALAVGLGPGSYTGIRVAVALALGWQLAREVRLAGVSSADALIEAAWNEGARGRVRVAIDAQRQEACLHTYQLEESAWHAVADPRLASAAEVQALLASGEEVIGPEMALWGSSNPARHPRARHVAALAQRRAVWTRGNELTPIYLRAASFVKAPPPRSL